MMPAAVGVDDERFAASPDGRADFFIAFADTADLTPTYYINWNARGHLWKQNRRRRSTSRRQGLAGRARHRLRVALDQQHPLSDDTNETRHAATNTHPQHRLWSASHSNASPHDGHAHRRNADREPAIQALPAPLDASGNKHFSFPKANSNDFSTASRRRQQNNLNYVENLVDAPLRGGIW